MVAKSIDLPNLRKMFIPNPGYVIFDVDLAQADLQVVIWEANDDDLKQKIKERANLHTENAKDIFGSGWDTSPSKDPNSPYYKAKKGVHLTNYGGTSATLARHLAITVREAELFQKRWFAAHPGIKSWQERILHSLETTQRIYNQFGFQRYFFAATGGEKRLYECYKEALAWQPQSTIALLINKALINLNKELPNIVKPKIQVHDSFAAQAPIDEFFPNLHKIRECTRIPIPYEDPLIIDTGITASLKSWGDCHEIPWDAKDVSVLH